MIGTVALGGWVLHLVQRGGSVLTIGTPAWVGGCDIWYSEVGVCSSLVHFVSDIAVFVLTRDVILQPTIGTPVCGW